jgi:hypothetical protein
MDKVEILFPNHWAIIDCMVWFWDRGKTSNCEIVDGEPRFYYLV